jgi:transposase
VPSRFTSSKTVGAAFGLTRRRHQSGEIDRMGGISKCGDIMMRKMLFEAALVLMTHSGSCGKDASADWSAASS